MNSINIIGNVVKAPDIRALQSGAYTLSFSIAKNRKYKKGDDWVEEVSFFNVSYISKSAGRLAEYIHKGDRIGISGELRQDRWEDAQGNSRSAVKIHATRIELLGSRGGSGSQTGEAPAFDDEDVPF